MNPSSHLCHTLRNAVNAFMDAWMNACMTQQAPSPQHNSSSSNRLWLSSCCVIICSDDCADRVHGLTTKLRSAPSVLTSEWGKTAQANKHSHRFAVPCDATTSVCIQLKQRVCQGSGHVVPHCWTCSGSLADCAGSPSIGAQLRWCVLLSDAWVTRLQLGHIHSLQ